MAATPPHQIRTDVHTPLTPLHGAAYDESPPRRHSARLSQRRISQESRSTPEITPRKNRSLGTPTRRSQDFNSRASNSPRPPKHRQARNVQVLSPSSPEFESSVPKPTASSHLHPTTSSSTTTMADGMLPTPVKTPLRKTVPKVNGAARALFQDQPTLSEEVAPPRRARKQRRFNGFSLESFNADDTSGRGGIQIFTDSRDQVPEPVTSEDNPFADNHANGEGPSVKKVAGGTKRRKISGEKKKDPQVQDAINRDEGMVYVFRGKKVYRRFDDMDEEEEVIDTTDLGLLDRVPYGASQLPMKTLTRKSIKPKRLFQTEEQKRAREAEKEEEAATDVEDESTQVDAPATASGEDVEVIDLITSREQGRPLRSPKKVAESKSTVLEKVKEHHTKNGSPFAAWKRVKSSAGSSASTSAKGTKRPGSEIEEATSSKKARAG